MADVDVQWDSQRRRWVGELRDLQDEGRWGRKFEAVTLDALGRKLETAGIRVWLPMRPEPLGRKPINLMMNEASQIQRGIEAHEEAIGRLRVRRRALAERMIADGIGLTDVAALLGISRQRVLQIMKD